MTTKQIVDTANEMGQLAWRTTAEALDAADKYKLSQNEDDKYCAEMAADHATEIREAWRAFMEKDWQ